MIVKDEHPNDRIINQSEVTTLRDPTSSSSAMAEEDTAFLIPSPANADQNQGKPDSKFLGMHLNNVIHCKVNVFIMFCTQFNMFLVEGYILNLISFTLINQYHVDKVKELPSVSSTASNIAEVQGMIMDVSFGLMLDIIGRKKVLASCYFLCAAGLFMLSLCHQVPLYYASRIMMTFMGLTGNCPFIPDYIQEKS